MKKKLFVTLGVLLGIVLIGLGFAGNYFYGEAVKRGVHVELYKGSESATAKVEAENNIIQTAKKWYQEQTFETVTMVSYDGLTLKADYLDHDFSAGKTVILAHGYRGHKEQMDDYVKFYYDQGFDVLMPDARGHGESEGDYIGYGWHDRKDYQGWIDLLIEDYNAKQIFLHGNSMGAATVLMTSGEILPEEVKGLIADSGYTTVEEELTHQLNHLYGLPAFPLLDITSLMTKIRAGYSFEEASAIDQVRKNTKPLLMIHGDQDELVPTEMAYKIYEAAGGEKDLWIVAGAGHTKAYTVATKDFQQTVQSFLNRTLSNE
ncbi:alpha/beta hydrolase [Salinibacillus xinjiangensis]|uniref:Alpha/beta fold hydrolase n=1 Tax=Salinibacillus xinjiangensis TaxID=1229268 RepID=A0A6G1X2E0_9BACI|nr:alpha/beta hydrolase [Salinibacillus xinjiangensis]MRG85112.1 alpha/beta fold hydrolase [Salinibacillus xinjiangensis]